MKKVYKYLIFAFLLLFPFFSEVKAANRDIFYGQVVNFISSADYSGVTCNSSGDVGVFKITPNGDDYYIEVKDPNASDATINISCNYNKRYVRSGDTYSTVNQPGNLSFQFTVSTSITNLSSIEVQMNRQYGSVFDLSRYLSGRASSEVDYYTLSSDFDNVIETSADRRVSCNTQSCNLKLKSTAPAGVTSGTLTFGSFTVDLIVDVSDYMMIQASTGYGTCSFGSPWERVSNSNFYRAYFSGTTATLPSCTVSNDTADFSALEFVGWVYPKTIDSINNYVNAALYQSSTSCYLFSKSDAEYTTDELNAYPNITTQNNNVGFQAANSHFTISSSLDNVYYACYKRSGIAFNLNGATAVNANGSQHEIHGWNTTGGIYYKNRTQIGSDTYTLPASATPSALMADHEFIGWDNLHLGYDGSNPDVLLPGGTSVSTESGYIYYPVFVRNQATTSTITKSVYVGEKLSLDLPDGFTCSSYQNTYYSVVATNNDCIVTGLATTNGSYEDFLMTSNGRGIIINIKVINTNGSDNVTFDPINLGTGSLLVDPGETDEGYEDEGSSSGALDCQSYFVGSPVSGEGVTITSNRVFNYKNSSNVTKSAAINTYYAESNCSDHAQYAALCIDPGRRGPTEHGSAVVRNDLQDGIRRKGINYTFQEYLDLNAVDNSLVRKHEFNAALAQMIYSIGYADSSAFNEINDSRKIAANIALRIIAIHTNYSMTADDAGDNNRYFESYMAYVRMEEYLRNKLGTADITYDEIRNGPWFDWNDDYFNAHFTYWYMNTYKNDIIELMSRYLSYDEDITAADWGVSFPRVTISEPNPDVVSYINATHRIDISVPENAELDVFTCQGGVSDCYRGLGIVVSSEIAEYYKIDFGSGSSTFHEIECVAGDPDGDGWGCTHYEIIAVDMTDWYTDGGTPIYDWYHNLRIQERTIGGIQKYPEPGTRDMAFYIKYYSNESALNAFIVVPSSSASSYQRMALFNPSWNTKYFDIYDSSCDVLLEAHGEDPAYFDVLAENGCCANVTDSSYPAFYSAKCSKDCVSNSFVPVCAAGEAVTTYKIKEGVTKNGTNDYRCIVDISSTSGDITFQNQIAMLNSGSGSSGLINTSNKTDITGANNIAIDRYNKNPYCRVTCKEEWQFNMPGFYEFIGANAVKAGSLFQINNSINLKSNITCVTSYINVAAYQKAMTDMTKEITDRYNEYAKLSAAHKDIVRTATNDTPAKGNDKIWYEYSYTTESCGLEQFFVYRNAHSSSYLSTATVSSCGVTGNIYRWCDTEAEYNAYSVCRTGTYEKPYPCSKYTVDEEGCSVGGSYSKTCTSDTLGEEGCSVTGNYSTDCDSDEVGCSTYTGTAGTPGTMSVPCDADTLDKTTCRVTGTYSIPCSSSDYNHTTCTFSGTYYVTTTCGSGDLNIEYEENCEIAEAWYDTGNDCTEAAHLTATGFVTDPSGEYDYDCSFTGSYYDVDQSSHTVTGNSGEACRIYYVDGGTGTIFESWKPDGNSNGPSGHSSTNHAETDFDAGSTNLCGAPNPGDNDYQCDLSTSTSISSGSCETDGSKTDATSWYDHLIETKVYHGSDTELIRRKMERLYNELNTLKTNMDRLVQAFSDCQNYYVKNTTASSAGMLIHMSSLYGGNGVYKVDGDKVPVGYVSLANIDTKFDPDGTFGYDEYGYMAQIGNGNNVIARNSTINMSPKTYAYNSASIGSHFAMCYGNDGSYKNGTTPTSCNGASTEEFASGTFNVSSEVKKLQRTLCKIVSDFGRSEDYDYNANNVLCAKTEFFYYDVNYIKKSLESQAYFDNKVTWYRQNTSQLISAGLGFANLNTLKNAMSRAHVSYSSEEAYNWSIMGTKNVFPISINTRRNMYQYYYKFRGIGNYFDGYSDRDDIGRVMGYEDSVVITNTRICFYEVYESACICCGHAGSTLVTTEASGVDTKSVVNANGYVYRMSSIVNETNSGQLGFNTSTVSLYSLNNSTSNILGDNWKDNDQFSYNGTSYSTNKGSELVNEIQKQGESIYAETPEYSYTLTPEAMAAIRRYNEGKTYGFAAGSVYSINNGSEMYSYLAYSNNINGFDVTSANIATKIKFSHYGSIFLRDYVDVYETSQYKSQLLTNKTMTENCYVKEGNVEDIYETNNYRNCKWVDYVEQIGSNYYRLAFK